MNKEPDASLQEGTPSPERCETCGFLVCDHEKKIPAKATRREFRETKDDMIWRHRREYIDRIRRNLVGRIGKADDYREQYDFLRELNLTEKVLLDIVRTELEKE